MDEEILGAFDIYCPYCSWRRQIEINNEYFKQDICCNGCGEDFTLEYYTETSTIIISGTVDMEEN